MLKGSLDYLGRRLICKDDITKVRESIFTWCLGWETYTKTNEGTSGFTSILAISFAMSEFCPSSPLRGVAQCAEHPCTHF
jgi:hypothetical protein